MLRFPFFSCYISPIASYPSLFKHNASLVRYNQTRFADSKYCGFVKTVVANMEKVIRICKDSFSPLVPRPHRRQPPVRLLLLQEEPPPLQGASSTARKPASPWRRTNGRITTGRPSRPGTGGRPAPELVEGPGSRHWSFRAKPQAESRNLPFCPVEWKRMIDSAIREIAWSIWTRQFLITC